MNYPLISEYIEAILSAEDNFDKLNNLRPVLDSNGNPIMSSGNFAVVFKMKDVETEKLYAVKCFTREQKERQERYQEIIKVLEEIKSQYFVSTHFYDKELFVDTSQDEETEFPVLVMDWVEGLCLDKYMQVIRDDKARRELLAQKFQEFVCWLLPKHFAHGDLKPDNIIVKDDGSLVLVDYDGMFVPSLYGKSALELGTPMFRYKDRTLDDFNEYVDDYATVFILLILKIGVTHPNVMDFFQNKDNMFNVFKNCVAFMTDKQIAPIVSAYIMVANYGYLERSLIFSLIANRESFNLAKEINLLHFARQGNTKEMIELAKLYEEGECVAKNVDKSMKWYELALKLGNSNAACGFCICLRRDSDISSLDYDVLFEKFNQNGCSFAYCRKGEFSNSIEDLQFAADRGFVPALYNLGKRYELLFKDKNKAIEYYTKAAEQGYTVAMHALRRLYKDNAVESLKLLERLAIYGNVNDQCELGLEYYHGNIIREDISKAIYWFEKAAKQEDKIAMYYLGEIYYNEEKYKDSSRAVYWWRKAAEIGQVDAQNCLAASYYDGDGIEKDVSKAIYWYVKAAKQGDKSAMCDLGIIYYNEKKDFPKAVYWWQKAAEDGYSDAQYYLGCYYHSLDKDYSKAVYWWEKAAANNSIQAMRELAICYFNGMGVECSIEMSNYWLKKTSTQQKEGLTIQKVLTDYEFVETLTVEQFRRIQENKNLKMRIDNDSFVLECGSATVFIINNAFPLHPLISRICHRNNNRKNEQCIWIIHEEGVECSTVLATF